MVAAALLENFAERFPLVGAVGSDDMDCAPGVFVLVRMPPSSVELDLLATGEERNGERQRFS